MLYLASIAVRYWPSDPMEPKTLRSKFEENSRYEIQGIGLDFIPDPQNIPEYMLEDIPETWDNIKVFSESYDPAENQGFEWIEDIYGLFVEVSEKKLNGRDPETVVEEKIRKSDLPKVLQKYGFEQEIQYAWR